METLLVKAMPRAKYYVPGSVTEQQRQHYALNLPLYTHFTNPSRRYADIIVHRQLEAALSTDGPTEIPEDIEGLSKTAEQCNNKKDSAHSAQEQSVHIESCRIMDRRDRKLAVTLSVKVLSFVFMNRHLMFSFRNTALKSGSIATSCP